MCAKLLHPNQCVPLHWIYGRDDCCLCRARAEIERLEARVKELEQHEAIENPKDGITESIGRSGST